MLNKHLGNGNETWTRSGCLFLIFWAEPIRSRGEWKLQHQVFSTPKGTVNQELKLSTTNLLIPKNTIYRKNLCHDTTLIQS